MYRIKTRNWYGKKWVRSLLDLSRCVGVATDPNDTDDNQKYWLETPSAVLAWSLWLYWSMLKPFSGGWTYIIRPHHELKGGTYESIY